MSDQNNISLEECALVLDFNSYYNIIFDKEGLQPDSNDVYEYPKNELEPIVKENFENFGNSKNKSIMYIHKASSEKKKKIDFYDDKLNSNNIQKEKANQSNNEINENKCINLIVIIESEKKQNIENKKNMFDVLCVFEPKLENIVPEQKQLREQIFQNINKKNKKENISLLKKKNKFNVLKPKNHTTQRKFKSDDIIKKIKARFLKSLKNNINNKLERANSKYLFDFLPQCFICSITKKRNNKSVLNMTFKEMMSTDFHEKYKKEKENEEKDINNKFLKKKRFKKKENKNNEEKSDKIIELKPIKKKKKKNNIDEKIEHPDKRKFNKNLEVIRYLEDNEEISKKINYEKIKNMKFSDLFNEYLKSKEFEDDIAKLKNEDNESQEYIEEYIIKASNYIRYF